MKKSFIKLLPLFFLGFFAHSCAVSHEIVVQIWLSEDATLRSLYFQEGNVCIFTLYDANTSQVYYTKEFNGTENKRMTNEDISEGIFIPQIYVYAANDLVNPILKGTLLSADTETITVNGKAFSVYGGETVVIDMQIDYP